MKITYCIPSKNNLRYLKSSVNSIRNNSKQPCDIIIYIDADSDGTEQWLIDNQIKYLKNETGAPKGIAYGYNRCIEAATSEVVCMFHADMYMAKGFDAAILKYLKPRTIVAGTRIEPPLHPEGREKIVKNFGMYPEDFMQQEFDEFTASFIKSNKDLITRGIFAPWACYKEDITTLGLHDDYLHSYYEDSDIFNRFILRGYDIIQTWEGLVYHLTCRGGQFQEGVEKITTDPAFHAMKDRSAKHYLRKWGSWIKNNEYQYPIIAHKYNIAFVIKHCNLQLLQALEPWCDRIYIEDDMQVLTDTYINQEQQNTKYDLKKRVLNLNHNYPEGENDIVVIFDARNFTNDSFNIIQNLSDIITQSGEEGTFQIDCFEIVINNMTTYEKDLILCNTI